MSLHVGVRGPGHLSRTGAAAGGIVTAAEVLGDISIAITSPSAQSVPMQTNGIVIKVTTSGVAAHTALDLTKITLSTTDLGHDTAKAQVAKARTIGVISKLYGPYNEVAVYQPVLGEFYLVLDADIYNQDATWKTTILSLNLAAGWLTGANAEVVTSITRSDSLAYPPFPSKLLNPPWEAALQSGATRNVQVAVEHDHIYSASKVACVEVWAVDAGAVAGTKVITSSYAISPSTPIDATNPGYPAAVYTAAVGAAGLTAGRCEWQYAVYPWIGPPVTSATYGDTFPTLNPAKGVPFCYDPDASYVPLYGLLSLDQAAAYGSKTLIANDVTVPVDVTGLSTTIAGAKASGKVYANLATLYKAVQTVNNSAVNVTIADPVTGGAFSYKRTTTHNDGAGAVAVCEEQAGSTRGSDSLAYAVWSSMSSQVTYPPGLVSFEIRSESGLPTDAVRWRATGSGCTTALASRVFPSRTRLRGLTMDSTGQATNTDNCVFNGNQATDTTPKSESAAIYFETADIIVLGTNAVAPTTPVLHNLGFAWHRRTLSTEPRGMAVGASPSVYNGGLVAALGCHFQNNGTAYIGWEPACVLGCKFTNVRFDGPVLSNRPLQRGRLIQNVRITNDIATITSSPFTAGGDNYPIQGGEGISNFLIDGNSVSSNFTIDMGADKKRYPIDNLIIYGLGSVWPSAADRGTTGRENRTYNWVGKIRVDKRSTQSHSAVASYNIKGDQMDNPETPTSVGSAHPGTGTIVYYKGAIVTNGGHGYQALSDVPIGILISNATYWLDVGVSSTTFAFSPLRQGNARARYAVGDRGNVYESNADSPPAAPGPGSWYGFATPKGGKTAATWANYYNNAAGGDYTPKPGGELVNRIAAGEAHGPFDLVGTAIPNDGTGAAGPLQVP